MTKKFPDKIHIKDISKYPELSGFIGANKNAKKNKFNAQKVTHDGVMAKFELRCRVAGLNGSDGLIREHYIKAGEKKKKYQLLLLLQKQDKISGQVQITYTRYTTRLMDWDNHGASFKYLGDSLVRLGIIEDDSPKIVKTFLPKQVKVSTKKEEKITIEILKL